MTAPPTFIVMTHRDGSSLSLCLTAIAGVTITNDYTFVVCGDSGWGYNVRESVREVLDLMERAGAVIYDPARREA